LVAAKGFTTIGPLWQQTLWNNLKPSFDKACCEGLNVLVWHEFVCSPAEQGMPGTGDDYDVITEEALRTRASIKDGRIVLPDGMSYRVLVLRDHWAISLPVLRKAQELVEAGATVVGPKPAEAMSLQDSDADVKKIADALWDTNPGCEERNDPPSKSGPFRYATGGTELGTSPDSE
jgi:hypothetical protein